LRKNSIPRLRPIPSLVALLLALALHATGWAAEELKVVVEGVDREAAQNVLAHLGAVDAALAAEEGRLQRALAAAVRDGMQPLGYYGASFSSIRKANTLRIDVRPGPRIVFTAPELHVDEPAASLPAIRALLAAPPFAAGAPLLHAKYDRFRDELLRSCRRLGFFSAAYRQSQLLVDPAAGTAQARLDLVCGERHVFGELEISGTRVHHDLLAALAPFRRGDPFDGDLLQRFERRLRDTAYFRELVVQMEPASDGTARVTVLADDMDTSRYELGAGFSTDSRLRLRFNRDTPLLNPAGHSLRIQSEFSEPRRMVEALYRMPHHDPLDDVLEITAGLQGRTVQDTDSLTASTGLRHALKLFGDWSYRYGASVEFERYTIASEDQKRALYLMPATGISRTRLAPGIDPLSGSAYSTAVDFSDRSIGSPADFLRWRGSGKWLTAFPDDNTTLLTRLELGAILTDGFNQMPASLRFFAGGDNSIRGYDYESIGPRDTQGKLSGGRYLAVGSVELSHRVLNDWRLAVFTDGGGAFDDQDDRLYQSVGVGVRWLSPIGQIRVDFAVPVRDHENSGFKLHISMGPPL